MTKTTPYDTLPEILEKLNISDENLNYVINRMRSELKEIENLKDSISYSGVTDYKRKTIHKKIKSLENRLKQSENGKPTGNE